MAVSTGQTKKYGNGKRRAPLDWRARGDEEGFSAFLAGIGGGISDLGRGLGNTASDIGDFFASRPASTKAGSQVFGPDRGQPGSSDRGELLRMRNRATADRLRQQESQVAGEEEQGPMGILDFLAQAQGLLGPGAGAERVSYDPMRAAARGRFSEGDAKLEAMYRQLGQSIAGQAASIGANYDRGAEGLNQNASQAADVVGDAYQSARDMQTRQLQQLGIQDSALVNAARGTDAAGDQAMALSNIEQNRAANVGANEAARQSGLAQNASHVSAAGLAGAEQRGRLQAELNQLLSQYDVAEQEQNAALASQGGPDVREALSIAQLLQEDYNSRLPQQPTFDQQIDLERLAIDRLKAMGSGRTLQDAIGDINTLQSLAKQQGVPEDRFSDWAKLVLGAV